MKHSSYLLILLFLTGLIGELKGTAMPDRINQAEENIRVFPNPIENKGTIEITLDFNSNTKIEFYDLSGKKVKEIKVIMLSAGANKIEFQANDLKQGFYMCKVSTDQWVKATRILIKR